ncbi:hypothetical protein [Xanthomonas fragariae]|nr:hypothetical protein [Xanthomonas fragariae]SMQ94695.1 hypothetical protein NBC2815_01347 [Xanthomonas fragariae]
MNDDTHNVLAQMTLAIGRLDTWMSNLQEQTKNAQAQMQATREKEEAKFKQAMVAQFQDQQQRLEAALRPEVAWAWKIIAALAGFSVLLLVG